MDDQIDSLEHIQALIPNEGEQDPFRSELGDTTFQSSFGTNPNPSANSPAFSQPSNASVFGTPSNPTLDISKPLTSSTTTPSYWPSTAGLAYIYNRENMSSTGNISSTINSATTASTNSNNTAVSTTSVSANSVSTATSSDNATSSATRAGPTTTSAITTSTIATTSTTHAPSMSSMTTSTGLTTSNMSSFSASAATASVNTPSKTIGDSLPRVISLPQAVITVSGSSTSTPSFNRGDEPLSGITFRKLPSPPRASSHDNSIGLSYSPPLERPRSPSPLAPRRQSPPLQPPLNPWQPIAESRSKSSSSYSIRDRERSPRLASSDGRGKSPPNKDDSFESKINSMNLIQLMKKFRDIESSVNYLKRKRDDCDKLINDIVRGGRGVTVDSDPALIKKKDERAKIVSELKSEEQKMKKIQNRLSNKFNMIMKEQLPRLTQTRKRAKMSTTPHTLSKEPHYERLLDLDDPETWCEHCNAHFENVREYLEHVHLKSHTKNAPAKVAPWRVKREKDDLNSTYTHHKRMVTRLEQELNDEYPISRIDQVLYPDLTTNHQLLKEKMLARERGRLDKSSDRLFQVKGYNYLMPLTGFYCSLCSVALCDQTEAEQHLRMLSHQYNYARLLALNPLPERTMRKAQYKAKTKLQRSEQPDDEHTSPIMTGHKRVDNVARPNMTAYKKPTSRIVDEHETIRGQFVERVDKRSDKRGINQNRLSTTSSANRPNAQSILRRPSHALPEIVPIGQMSNKPSALRRLKRHPSELLRERRKTIDDKEDTQEEAIEVDVDEPTVIEQEVVEQVDISTSKKKTPTSPESASSTAAAKRRMDDDEDNENRNDDSKRPAKKAYYDSDSDSSDDIFVMAETVMPVGDPKSPFPDLEIRISGNAHSAMSLDSRLKNGFTIKLERMDINNYNDMLFNEEGFWARVSQMVTKKEKAGLSLEELCNDKHGDRAKTSATYFNSDDTAVPVDIDDI